MWQSEHVSDETESDTVRSGTEQIVLANERTFLAWVRTGLALIVTGVALATFKVPIPAQSVCAPQLAS